MSVDLSDVKRHSTLTTRVTFAPGVRFTDMIHRTAPPFSPSPPAC